MTIPRLDQLLLGADPGLVMICEGILSGLPFVYPAEKLGVYDASFLDFFLKFIPNLRFNG